MSFSSEKLEDFFDKSLKEACEKCQTKMSESTHEYLVSLLNLYTLSYNLFETCENTGKLKNKVLAHKYFSFLEKTDPSEKEKILKDLADSCLYMIGFFNEKLQNTLMGLNYYTQMGESSYNMLSHLSLKHKSVYKDLGENFHPFTIVLRFIKRSTSLGEPRENSDLLISEVFEPEAQKTCLSKSLGIKKN